MVVLDKSFLFLLSTPNPAAQWTGNLWENFRKRKARREAKRHLGPSDLFFVTSTRKLDHSISKPEILKRAQSLLGALIGAKLE